MCRIRRRARTRACHARQHFNSVSGCVRNAHHLIEFHRHNLSLSLGTDEDALIATECVDQMERKKEKTRAFAARQRRWK